MVLACVSKRTNHFFDSFSSDFSFHFGAKLRLVPLLFDKKIDFRGFPVLDVVYWLSNPGYPVLAVYPVCPVLFRLPYLYWLSCSSSYPVWLCCPVLATWTKLSCLVPPVLSCPACPVLGGLSWAACPGWSVLAGLSWLYCPGCTVLATLLWLYYPGCPVLAFYFSVSQFWDLSRFHCFFRFI